MLKLFHTLTHKKENYHGFIIFTPVKLQTNTTLKRLKNRYRLVVMNEDTYEEVVTFRLTRTSVYILMSTLFVVMISLTVALITFTPLKYYLPGAGYGNARELRELKRLKIRTDSMEQSLKQQQVYYLHLKNVLQGSTHSLDTTLLPTTALEKTED